MVEVAVTGALLGGGDQDVAGLDVAVHEPELVRRVEGVADLHEDPEQARQGHAARLAEQRLEVAAGDVAHRDEQLAVRLARLVDRDDVRVVERGGQP